MAESNVSSKAEEVGVNVGEKRDRLVVHIVRVLVKLGIVLTLVLSNSPNYLVLSIYLVVTEVLDQFSIYFSRLNPKFKRNFIVFGKNAGKKILLCLKTAPMLRAVIIMVSTSAAGGI